MTLTCAPEFVRRTAMSEKFIREPERRSITGVPTSTWYEMMEDGRAPRPVPIGPRAVAWPLSELSEWQAQRIAERDAA